MKRYVSAIIGVGLLLAASVLPASADHIGAHVHFLVTPNGDKILVGPDPCITGPSVASDNFHLEVHRGTPNLDAFTQENNPVSLVAAGCP